MLPQSDIGSPTPRGNHHQSKPHIHTIGRVIRSFQGAIAQGWGDVDVTSLTAADNSELRPQKIPVHHSSSG